MSEVRSPELIVEQMRTKTRKNLKTICFEGQLLPDWAQLLFLAARLCPVAQDASLWFARLTSGSGVEDARTVVERCGLLRARHSKTSQDNFGRAASGVVRMASQSRFLPHGCIPWIR